MKKFELFPTPVMEFDFTNHPDLDSLLNNIDNLLPSLDKHNLVNKGKSSFGVIPHFLSSPNLIELKNDFQKCVEYYSQDLKIENSFINESWFNILDTKGETKIHTHGSSVISGAFYSLLEENTCNLCFRSPIYSSLNFQPLFSNSNNHFQEDIVMPIKQNHLYLFPSWLQHYTEENKGGKRIVVSFNTKFY